MFGIGTSTSMLQAAPIRLGKRANLYLGEASNMPYPDRKFDLIIFSTVLHEMPPATRSAAIKESKHTLVKDGGILFIDFHPGTIRSLRGWIYKSIITIAEIGVGREHFKNYRNFMTNKSLSEFISIHGLLIDKKRILSGGNIGIFLLRLKSSEVGAHFKTKE